MWRSAMLHLERHGHETRVLTTDTDTGASEPDDPNVRRDLRWYLREREFPPLPRGEILGLERHNARVLRAELRGFRPDVVTWWSMGGMSLSMVERVRRAGIPAVGFVVDDWLDYGPKADGWTRALARRPRLVGAIAERVVGAPARLDLERAARYVFVSETTRGRAEAAGIRPASSGIAHGGIPASFIGPAPEREWEWRLLYVGRLDPRKGVHTAVEALAQLPEAATLTLVGGWDDREERRLREVASDRGVEGRVRFEGQRSREEAKEAYDNADLVIFPVVWEEPWGLVPIEAMARGRPVVATGRGGSGEYLRDGENALLFDAEDADALARAVTRFAEDPELRRRLREGGLATARHHTEDRYNDAVLREIEAAGGARCRAGSRRNRGSSIPKMRCVPTPASITRNGSRGARYRASPYTGIAGTTKSAATPQTKAGARGTTRRSWATAPTRASSRTA
jgi:glycosyltransferase involved in cell wall biosynthesis